MGHFAFTPAPVANEVSDAAVAARIAICLNLGKQLFGGTPVLFETRGFSFECLFQRGVEGGEFAKLFAASVTRWLRLLGTAQPPAYGVAR